MLPPFHHGNSLSARCQPWKKRRCRCQSHSCIIHQHSPPKTTINQPNQQSEKQRRRERRRSVRGGQERRKTCCAQALFGCHMKPMHTLSPWNEICATIDQMNQQSVWQIGKRAMALETVEKVVRAGEESATAEVHSFIDTRPILSFST